MMSKSKLLPYIAIGALVGAAISMFDKTTRQQTVEATKKLKETVSYYSENTDELQNLIDTKMDQVQSLYTSANDNLNDIIAQAEDVKTLPSTIQSLLTETKDVFLKRGKEA